jgi:hypothetical protein
MKKIFKIILPFLLLLILSTPFSALAKTLYYTNVYGSKVHVPVQTQVIPIGASAKCGDSSYSFSASRRGTCSHHGGVRIWYK